MPLGDEGQALRFHPFMQGEGPPHLCGKLGCGTHMASPSSWMGGLLAAFLLKPELVTHPGRVSFRAQQASAATQWLSRVPFMGAHSLCTWRAGRSDRGQAWRVWAGLECVAIDGRLDVWDGLTRLGGRRLGWWGWWGEVCISHHPGG